MENVNYSNYSLDKNVAFVEDGHKYVHLTKPELDFTSVTTLIANYKEKFDAEEIAKRCVANKTSKYYGQDWMKLADNWRVYGEECAGRGTALHTYGEQLFQGNTTLPTPDDIRATHAQQAVKDILAKGYRVAKTELLVYSDDNKIAGQSDVVLKKIIPGTTEFNFMIYDWKFLTKPLRMRSKYLNSKSAYLQMTGPFQKLMDCNWIHYSIQLAMYQTLTGEPAKVVEKVMIVVTEDGYKLVPAYPMRVFWDMNGELQCVHETYNGRWWDSRMKQMYRRKPKDIVGI